MRECIEHGAFPSPPSHKRRVSGLTLGDSTLYFGQLAKGDRGVDRTLRLSVVRTTGVESEALPWALVAAKSMSAYSVGGSWTDDSGGGDPRAVLHPALETPRLNVDCVLGGRLSSAYVRSSSRCNRPEENQGGIKRLGDLVWPYFIHCILILTFVIRLGGANSKECE